MSLAAAGMTLMNACSQQGSSSSSLQNAGILDTSTTQKSDTLPLPNASPSDSPSPLASVTPSPSPAFQGSHVQTPFQLELTQTDLDNIFLNGVVLPSLSGSFTEPLADLTVTNPITVKLTGLNLTFNYAFNQPTFNESTDIWQLAASSLSADLNISRIDATQTIQVNQGGTQINVTLNGYCDQVHLTLPNGATTANGTVQVDFSSGEPHFTLTSLSSSWTPGAWSVASMDCHGPNGFDQVVAKAAEQQLRQIDPFLDKIKQIIQSNLDQVGGNNLSLSLGFAPNITLNLEVQKFTTLGGIQKFIQISGKSDFSFTNVPQGTGCGIDLSSFPSPPTTTMAEDSITFPSGIFNALVSCLYLNKSFQNNFTSDQLPSFKSFKGNWFEEFFVWPDLLNFKKSSVFNFDVLAQAMPSFLNLRAGTTDQVLADADLPLTIDVNAPKNGQNVPYIHFFPTLSGPTGVSIKSGLVTLSLLDHSTLNLDKAWDSAYLTKYKPNTFIWTGLISMGIEDYLENSGLSFQLPALAISPQLGMTFEDVNLEGANVRFGVSFANPHPAKSH